MSKDSFDLSKLPEKITVTAKNAKKRVGTLTTEDKRRLYDPRYRNRYSDAKKMEVACCMAVCGNSKQASEVTRVPEATIRTWKTTEWWNEIMSRIHQEEDEELDTKLTKLVNKAVASVNERLDNGDWIYNAKQDKLVRKPVSAKDAAIVSAISIDKRQLLRGQPTSRVEKVSQNERLTKLAEQFRTFSLAREVESTAIRVEEEQYIEPPVEDIEDEEEDTTPTVNELFGEE